MNALSRAGRRKGTNSSGVGKAHHGTGTHLGRHPDRAQALTISDAMRRMHSHPNTQHEPPTPGEKMAMASQAEQLMALANRPAE